LETRPAAPIAEGREDFFADALTSISSISSSTLPERTFEERLAAPDLATPFFTAALTFGFGAGVGAGSSSEDSATVGGVLRLRPPSLTLSNSI
jgi:hypothetical protein